MSNIILKIGHLGVVILMTLASIILSVLTTFVMMENFAQGLDQIGITISIIVPSIVAPIASWYIVGLLLKIHKLEQTQRELATYDMLTGVMTRRAFLENCKTLMKLIERNKKSMSLAYIDLDNFKKINDLYGHAGGDEILKFFATNLQQHLRESDLVGRIGGEEFAIAMPNTGLKDSIHVLEAIRLSSKNNTVKYSSKTIQYTISIGVALFDKTNLVDLEKLSRQSDIALYNAKKSGKDCIAEYKDSKAN